MREGPTAEQAASFGAAAAEYERARPTYPDAAVDWIVPARARAALDVGAGTGKLTRALLGRGLAVTAVEPSEGMRQTLEAELPAARALAGAAEELPLADASVDLVTCAQAWHWVDTERAELEAARVLRPGGRLACVWNLRDDSRGWMRAISGLLESLGAHNVVEEGFAFGGRFGPTESFEVRWSRPMNADRLVELFSTRSYVIVAPEPERRRLLGEVRELTETHPELAGRESFEMPYITRCFRAALAPG
jgi:SAM-dependent methyltransferase